MPPAGDVVSRPGSMEPEQLGFTPRRPVPWLSPFLLAGTAVRVGLAELFGAYLDKRELQDALPGPVLREGDGELWMDYIADTGDGFNPTYSIAYLAAQPSLTIDGTDLPRGEVLILGGDQVYPTASGQQYDDRFKGPFHAALPVPPAEGAQPRLYAVPGNHDWYDGLTAFLRLFVRAHDGDIGGWQTRQTRSYFAIELPQRWWLLGIDVQPGSYIDDPQLRYFNQAASRIQPGDKVIICPPSPGWVEAVDDRHAYDSIDYFVRTVIQPTGAAVKLMISGDLHHYARYSGPDRELITAGGGGAYLYPTHELPAEITVPPPRSLMRRSTPSGRYTRKATYPTGTRSRALALGIFWRLPARNPQFVALLGLLQTLTMLAFANTAENLSVVTQRLVVIPAALMLIVDVGAATFLAMPREAGQRRPRHWILGLSHGAAVVGLAILGTWAWLSLPLSGLHWPLPLVLAVVLYFPLVSVVAGQVLALYFLVAARFNVNVNELFSAQGITDYKGFLRMHFAADGSLTIYPIGVDRTGTRWLATPDAAADRPWFEPARPLVPHLVEPPIRIE